MRAAAAPSARRFVIVEGAVGGYCEHMPFAGAGAYYTRELAARVPR